MYIYVCVLKILKGSIILKFKKNIKTIQTNDSARKGNKKNIEMIIIFFTFAIYLYTIIRKFSNNNKN